MKHLSKTHRRRILWRAAWLVRNGWRTCGPRGEWVWKITPRVVRPDGPPTAESDLGFCAVKVWVTA